MESKSYNFLIERYFFKNEKTRPKDPGFTNRCEFLF